MLSCEDCVLVHCKRIYGSRVLYRNRAVYIQTEEDTYKIDLSLSKDGVFCFRGAINGSILVESNLARGFFRIAAYPTYKKIGLVPSLEDWERFLMDAYSYEKTCGGY